MENFNVEIVKRHIKNLIAGNGVSNADMLDLYKNFLEKAVKERINKMIVSRNLDCLVEKMVNYHITKYMNELIKKEHKFCYGNNFSGIETMVRSECTKQINEIIKQNLKISFDSGEIKISNAVD